ncbi:hypothetical protein D3C86_2243000 [compost metagenome]
MGLSLHFQHNQFLYRLSIYQMLSDNTGHIIRRYIVIPDAVGIDDYKRAVSA